MGAYLALVGSAIPILGAFLFNSIYKFPAYRFECTNVFTSKTPTDAYRGAGRPEATFAIERTWTSWPSSWAATRWTCGGRTGSSTRSSRSPPSRGLHYDSGNYEAATAKATELFDYDGLRREQQERRDRNDPVQLGIGISTFTEMCGLAPSRCSGALGYVARRLGARVHPDAAVRQGRGGRRVSAHGQGHETAWSQIVADQLGVAFEDVEVLHGDTQISHGGLDTYGSRSLVVGGIAVVNAAREGGRQGADGRRAPARGVRGRPGVLRRAASGCGARTRAWRSGDRVRHVPVAQLPGRASSRRSTPTRPSTRRRSPSRTAPTSRRWRSTPRPGGRRCAATSASTTSARR